jgi:hypothetical protein
MRGISWKSLRKWRQMQREQIELIAVACCQLYCADLNTAERFLDVTYCPIIVEYRIFNLYFDCWWQRKYSK